MRIRPRLLRAPLKMALVVATVITTGRAIGWSYHGLCPAGRKEAALARVDALFEKGLEALHRCGERIATIDAWSKAIALCRPYPGTEADQAGLNTHLADVLIELGRNDEALDRYEQALDLYGRARYTSLDRAYCRRRIAELRAAGQEKGPDR